MLFDFNDMRSFNRDFPAFDQNVLGQQPFKLLVWADWCGHCTRMKPDWLRATKSCVDTQNIVQIEHTVAKHLQERHSEIEFVDVIRHAQGYPFLATVSFAMPNRTTTPTVHVDEHKEGRDLTSLLSFLKDSETKRPMSMSMPAPTPTPTPTP
jgi:hypothetical protein